MKKFVLTIAVVFAFIACDDAKISDKVQGKTLYQEILPSGRVDTTLIRFIFENEGNSKLTGKVWCSKKEITSNGEYYKYSKLPLRYFMQQSPELFSKTVLYYQIDSLTLDSFRIKVTFPDTTKYVNNVPTQVKDTLVYKAYKYKLP